MTRAENLCDKCDKPLGDRWWLTLFHDDGREEKIAQGQVPKTGGFVSIRMHFRCPKGFKGRVSQEQQALLRSRRMPGFMQKDTVPEVDDGGRVWSLDDLVIQRKGDRILKVVPKMVAVV
jgi:hypothetical protein